MSGSGIDGDGHDRCQENCHESRISHRTAFVVETLALLLRDPCRRGRLV
jgi:hypothetical protein